MTLVQNAYTGVPVSVIYIGDATTATATTTTPATGGGTTTVSGVSFNS